MEARRIARYEVLRKLGQGGMGEVYLANDQSLDRSIALKILHRDLLHDERARSRFVAEAKAAAALDHPFICKVYEAGESEAGPYIAMEYVEGITLKERLAQGPLPVAEAIRVVGEVIEALETAHKRGIIHRDLKPSNIMLIPGGHVKVMDFGLAKRLADEEVETLEESLTRPGHVVGTVNYMSPEQLMGEKLDARSDIFSMGIVLYEMLAGVHPFMKDSPVHTANAILSDAALPLARYREDLPELLHHTVKRMLAKHREERYASIHDVRMNLLELVGDSSASAAPAAAARGSTLRALRPAWLAAVILALAFGVAGFSYFIYERYFQAPEPALAFRQRDWILITDFDNQTGDEIFDRSLRAALTVGIQQSQYVNVFPDARVQETLQRMRRERPEAIDEALGSEIAQREGIKGILACGISRVGDTYSITARLVDPQSRTAVVTEAAQAKGKDEVLPALDVLARSMRQHLGESLASISRQGMPLPSATTASLTALKTYVESQKASLTDARAGYSLMQQAVELDPDFALAHAELGRQEFIRGSRGQGEEHFKKALSLLDRLTLREQLWIRALVEDWRGNRELAVQHYRGYLAQYPDDKTAWFRMGWTQMATLGQAEQAMAAFRRVLELDPGETASLINLASCNNILGRYQEAMQDYEKAFELRPAHMTELFVNHEYGFTLVKMGHIAKAQRTFEQLIQSGGEPKARGLRSLALLEMYQGKMSAAAQHFRDAIMINRAIESGLSELRDRMYLATVLKFHGRDSELAAELDALERMLGEGEYGPDWLALAGKIFARNRRLPEARKLLHDLEARLNNPAVSSGINRSSRGDQGDLHWLTGEIALQSGQPAQAAESFELAVTLKPNGNILESLAAAYLALGREEMAARRFEELVAKNELGLEAQEHWLRAHYQLGRLCEKRGEASCARIWYGRLLELWKEADSDLPLLRDAQARLAGL